MDDIFIFWMAISMIIRVKKPTIHPDSFWLGVQSIDPFQSFYIADLSEILLGRTLVSILHLMIT